MPWKTKNDQFDHWYWGIFNGCTNLIGGQGTKYDPNHTGIEYARIDGGEESPGYFTLKPVITVESITQLIDAYLKNDNLRNSENDIDGDGQLTVSDITALINQYLKQ